MISGIVLSHNDESTILRTIESLSFCDEVIDVDDYSSDTTVDIAKKYGAKVYSRQLNDDFSAQRNFGLNQAKGDWVLFVDSDEVVTPELGKEIRFLTQHVIPVKTGIHNGSKNGSPIGSGMTKPLGYFIKRSDFLFGKWLRHGETGDIKLLRLARKDTGTWIRPVHEVWDVQGPTGVLKKPLLHYPHPNVAQFLTDINHYSTLNAKYLYKTNTPSHAWQILVYPKAKFFLNYVIRLGFLDGTQGFMLALLMSFHSFLTRGKLWLLHHKQ